MKGLFGMRSVIKRDPRRSIYDPAIGLTADKGQERKYEQERVELKNKFAFREALKGKKLIGLKVVVDARLALEVGVPPLLKALEAAGTKASFFVATGAEPGFKALLARLRGGGAGIVEGLEGTAGEILRAGHDAGVHGHDPGKWVRAVDRRDEDLQAALYNHAIEEFERVFGAKCASFSAPSYACSNATILLKENFFFDYSSDCRGTDPFFPVIDPRVMKTPQVPVTLPTLAEWLGAGTGAAERYFEFVLDEAGKQKYPVMEIDPLLEGVEHGNLFRSFLGSLEKAGMTPVTLREMLGLRIAEGTPLPRCTLSYGLVEGRKRPVTIQMLEV